EVTRELARRDTLRDRGIEQTRAVEMQAEPVRVDELARGREVVARQRPAVPGVLEAEQAGAREMRIERLDRALQGLERQCAVGRLRDRLWLDRAEHRGAAAFVLVGVRFHADEVFVAALAVA